jgi:hypothetical protein
VDLRVAALKIGEHVGKQIETGSFVGAENERALHNVSAVSHDLDGFIAEAEKSLGVFEKDLAGRSQLDGFSGTVQETGAVGLFELANLGADGGLRTKNLLSCAREAL